MLPAAKKPAIFLDSNSGAPLRLEVREALLSFLARPDFQSSGFNPSSVHKSGQIAKRISAEARTAVARSLGPAVDAESIAFTSSGTEANQWVIRTVLDEALKAGRAPHWVTTPVEHDSVLQMRAWAQALGVKITLLPVDRQGVPNLNHLNMLADPVDLLSLLWVNNETGAITPIERAAAWANEHSVALHVDGAQAWGKLPLRLDPRGGIAYLTLSAHKVGGLPGTGAVWAASGHRLRPVLFGKQEKGRRGGTENLMGQVAMGAAAGALNPDAWVAALAPSRDALEQAILSAIPGATINAQGAPRVAGTLNVSFDGVAGEGLVLALDLAGFAVSAGSACSSGALEPSHVLLAMGHSREQAMASIRVSLAAPLAPNEQAAFVGELAQIVKRIRLKAHGGLSRQTEVRPGSHAEHV